MKKSTVFSVCCWAFSLCIWADIVYKWHNPEPPEIHDQCTKESLAMQVQLDPYFDEFIKDCESHGVKSDHVYCLKGMGFSTRMDCNGYTDYSDEVIRINAGLLDDPIGLRFVLYHEIGHWLGLRHSDGIMKDSYGPSDTQWVQDNWDTLKREYFEKLKH